MKSYQSSTIIDASQSEVWRVVLDAAAYPQWDSGVLAVEGSVKVGAKLKVTSSAAPARAFPVRVTELQPDRRMVWTGGMPLGLFRGVRRFELEPEAAGTRFTLAEDYTGPLVPLIWRSMPDLQPSFDQFVQGLRRRVE